MSEPTPQPQQRHGNVLTRKLGPLPTWAWILIAAALVFGVAWWRQRSKPSSDTAGSGQVPQFVNQTYVSPEPPGRPDHEPDRDKHRRRHPRDRDHDRHHRPEPARPTGSEGSMQGGKTPVPYRLPFPPGHRRGERRDLQPGSSA